MKFKADIFKFLSKIKREENFAFTRFSDGEILIMQNKELVLQSSYVKTGDVDILKMIINTTIPRFMAF